MKTHDQWPGFVKSAVEQAKTRAELAKTRRDQVKARAELVRTREKQTEMGTQQVEKTLQRMMHNNFDIYDRHQTISTPPTIYSPIGPPRTIDGPATRNFTRK